MVPSRRSWLIHGQHLIESGCDLGNASFGENRPQQTLCAVEGDQRRRLLVVHLESLGDRALVVVRALKEPVRATLFRAGTFRGRAAS
jgi:hypothetical protein